MDLRGRRRKKHGNREKRNWPHMGDCANSRGKLGKRSSGMKKQIREGNGAKEPQASLNIKTW